MSYKVILQNQGEKPEVLADVPTLGEAFVIMEALWMESAKSLYENDVHDWKCTHKKSPDTATLVELRKTAYADTQEMFSIEDTNEM